MIKESLLQRLIEGIEKNDKIPQSIREYYRDANINVIEDENLKVIVDENPRIFFDAFDKNNIYIGVLPIFLTNNKVKFTFLINEEVHNPSFENRIEAERAALQVAFNVYG